MFDDPQVIQYLKDLVYQDLERHFTGDPQSIISADQLEFNLLPEEVSFRKKILMRLEMVKTNNKGQKQNTPMSFVTFESPNFKSLNSLNRQQSFLIARSMKQKRKIEAIKYLREYTGLGLKEAKTIIDSYLPNNPISDTERENRINLFLDDCKG